MSDLTDKLVERVRNFLDFEEEEGIGWDVEGHEPLTCEIIQLLEEIAAATGKEQS